MATPEDYALIFQQNSASSDNPFAGYNLPFEQEVAKETGEELGRSIAIDESSWDKDDTAMTARMFVDGMWFNKGEEVASWIGAAAYKLFGMYGSENQSVADIREEMLQRANAQQAQFQEERPAAAISANIAGSIVSPASIAGGQLLSRAAQVRRAAQARKSAQSVSSALGSTAIAGAAPTRQSAQLAQQLSGFSPRALSVIEKTPVPVLGAALTGGEAAIIGAEGNTIQEKIQNAGTSAALGALFSGGISLAGMGINKAVQSKVAQDLGKGADFVSLMFTDHLLAPAYKHVVSKAFGAKTLMQQQAQRVTSRIKSVDNLKAKGVELEKDAKATLKLANRIINSEKEEAVDSARLLADQIKDDLTLKSGIDLEDLDDVSRARVDGLKNAQRLELEEIKANAAKEADQAVNAVEGAFRSKVSVGSLPSAAPKDLADDIQTLSPQEALETIRRAWSEYGFRSAKTKSIPISIKSINRNIERIISERPEKAILEGPTGVNLAKRITQYVNDDLANALDGASSGNVRGEVLVNLRSNIGQLINSLSENKSVTREVIKPIQKWLDDYLLKRLRPGSKASQEFKADREIWRIKSTLEDAAQLAIKKNGAFGAEDWIQANKSQSKALATIGKGIYQKEAQEIVGLTKARDKQIETVAKQTSKMIREDAFKAINSEQKRLSALRKDALRTLNQETKAARASYAKSRRSSTNKAELDARMAAARQAHRVNMQDIGGQLNKLRASRDVLEEIAPRKEISMFEQLFASSLLLSALSGPFTGGFGAYAALSGLGLARGLGTESAQRFFAGQTGAQRVGAKFADSIYDVTNKLADKYGITVPTVVAAATAQGTRPQVVFSEDAKKAIVGLSPSRKRSLFMGVLRRGQEDALKEQDPALYRDLKSAYDSLNAR